MEMPLRVESVDLDQEVLVIAEIGNNHEGSFGLAEEMIGRAAEAGVQAVKFQTFITEQFISSADPARRERLGKFDLGQEAFAKLAAQAKAAGLMFLSTPFDLTSARFLDGIVPAFKISSGDNTFLPLLEAVARTAKPIILSTGLAGLPELRRARSAIQGIWDSLGVSPGLAFLHCVSSYPVPAEQANLATIPTLAKALKATVGYSDHCLGIEAAVLSVAFGARIVEKHFTLDKAYSDFRDHQLSADPAEMKQMVERIREARLMAGNGLKVLQPSEVGNDVAFRRSIAAASALPAGTVLGAADLIWVRPGSGLRPGLEHRVIGKTLKRPLTQGELILAADLA